MYSFIILFKRVAYIAFIFSLLGVFTVGFYLKRIAFFQVLLKVINLKITVENLLC